MVHYIKNFALQNRLQFLEVEDHPGYRVRFPLQSHLKHVIMPVAVRVCSIAINRLILLLAQRRNRTEMRS